ncbi:hypothetical protein BIW11_05418 [Tropilaelaps mercedesae]|uniref:Uncharacterized protein n=1 Tax=Tropilaelaps mercedesae TaxID=418985 RepID=A0A1V9Y2F6_9ACAR|nr:hypothetical protein BIW11_05418 [Tropilaelaps mercedesae]
MSFSQIECGKLSQSNQRLETTLTVSNVTIHRPYQLTRTFREIHDIANTRIRTYRPYLYMTLPNIKKINHSSCQNDKVRCPGYMFLLLCTLWSQSTANFIERNSTTREKENTTRSARLSMIIMRNTNLKIIIIMW